MTQLKLPTIQNHLFSCGNASHVRLVAVRCGPSMCCICVFSWYLKFCSEPSCSPLKPLILTTMSWHACPSSGKIVNSACSYNLNTKSGWPGPLLFFLHPLSARHSLCEHQRGRQAGRALMPARLGGLMVQPRGRVRPLRRTKAAHNERKRAWISPLLGKSLGFHSMEESKDGSRKMKMICAYWQGQNLVV